MGLDMYFKAERYVSAYTSTPEHRQAALALAKDLGIPADYDEGGIEVLAVVGYWRKANAIHKWFVDNVQDGKDECQRSYVSREQMEQLRSLCQQVLDASELIDGTIHNGTLYSAEHPQGAVQLEQGKIIKDPTVAHKLLPTTEGFFFGGTDYDEWYYNDIKHTVEILDKCLAAKDLHFYYEASW